MNNSKAKLMLAESLTDCKTKFVDVRLGHASCG